MHQFEQEIQLETLTSSPWYVVLFNDEVHSFDDVVFQLMKATGCAATDADNLAWTVHSSGKARVFDGDLESCLRVSGVLREITLVTEVQG
ncbi:MAG: ATP-dependent Clp protease adaptor ClpS [Bacteroidetes bacterium]|nr:MAG: ATP-dependent Clp protease adaptor ClpS [Bacteroidota bacterium]